MLYTFQSGVYTQISLSANSFVNAKLCSSIVGIGRHLKVPLTGRRAFHDETIVCLQAWIIWLVFKSQHDLFLGFLI